MPSPWMDNFERVIFYVVIPASALSIVLLMVVLRG